MTPPRRSDLGDVGSTPWDLSEDAHPAHALDEAADERSRGHVTVDEVQSRVEHPTRGGVTVDAVESRVEHTALDHAALDHAAFLEGAVLAEVTFAFEVHGDTSAWRVLRLHAREGVSELYECRVDLVAADLAADADALLGQRCVVRLARHAPTRRFHGVVRRVEHLGTSGGQRLARVYVVPALWALTQRLDSRIFEDQTAIDVVLAVLRDAGFEADDVSQRLRGRYLPREYCVQHRETDHAFVSRLLEEEGIAYFFRHDGEAEVLVLADHVDAWEAVRTLDGGPATLAGAEAATSSTETVRHLDWGHELRPTSVTVRDYDFTRPGYDLTRRAPRVDDDPRPRYEQPCEAVFARYAHGVYAADNAAAQAQSRHEAEAALTQRGEGLSNATVLAPGCVLSVAGHDRAELDPRQLVLRVEHHGEAPEGLTHATQHSGASQDRYHNTFACMPARVPLRPARVTPRPTVASIQTATVVGPPDEEIHVDEHGRVRVRFHWDRGGYEDARASAWIRVVQGPWAGNGWGMQFIPRVGMEVVVQFLEGNPDRPVVSGALYNGRNRLPYTLPAEKTRSGLRSNSSPGGAGSNELRFEDLAGHEEVYLHAQRDHAVLVERDEAVTVRNDQRVTVTRDQTVRVGGARDEHVDRDLTQRVGGRYGATVHGPADVRFDGHLTTHAGAERRTVAGASERSVGGDDTHRVRGCQTVLVGRHDARRTATLHVEGVARTWASDRVELECEQEIVLRCGQSMIRLTTSRIELDAPTLVMRGRGASITAGDQRICARAESEASVQADRVTLQGSGASACIDDDASLRGGAIRLDTARSPSRDERSEARPRTVIELVDQHGRPMPGQRYIIARDDGSELGGMLDEHGRAEIDLEGPATVLFPEVPPPERG